MSRIIHSPYVTATFTFIRHGESTDNLKSLWAGWKDSSLSNHGQKQAEALAASFASTHFTAIYSSPLKRALMTAETLQNAQPDPKPRIETSPLLREQHYGLGEGQRYDVRRVPGLSTAEHFARGKFPPLYSRTERFPEGESLEDVAERAEEAVEQFAIPYIRKAAEEGRDGMNVAFVSHGVLIREAIAALMKKDKHNTEGINAIDFRGMQNTGWTRLTVQVKDVSGQKDEALGDESMSIRVSVHNSCEHLDGLVRQKGGIGSATYDPKQKDIRMFFKSSEGVSKTCPR